VVIANEELKDERKADILINGVEVRARRGLV
jgi:hypothetical protein